MSFAIAAHQEIVSLNQENLLRTNFVLDEEKRMTLEESLSQIDKKLLEKEFLHLKGEQKPSSPFSPYHSTFRIGNSEARLLGESYLRSGKVGTIILAGGHGSRFGSETPKGTFPVSLIKKKSLFQLLIEKTISCQKSYGKLPAIAIMTSETTHDDTLDFFKINNFFGLTEQDIDFFKQSSLPVLDEQANLMMAPSGKVVTAPDGNGSIFWSFSESSTFSKWQSAGIEYITVCVVDNPLLDPYDAELIGFHVQQGNDITVAAIPRSAPDEKVGVLAEREEHLAVIEYSELPDVEKKALDASGNLKYPLANISFFTFSMPFIKEITSNKCDLPLHKAKKSSTPALQKQLNVTKPFAFWKFEYFIFDVLAYTSKSSILEFPRDRIFAPLKNAAGDDSPETVQKALLERDRKVFYEISGVQPPLSRLFELSQAFYYPTAELRKKWKGKALPPNDYIEE